MHDRELFRRSFALELRFVGIELVLQTHNSSQSRGGSSTQNKFASLEVLEERRAQSAVCGKNGSVKPRNRAPN
jgi:hypothetical protein